MEENVLSRVYFKEILKRINKKDKRSVKNWCKKNNVEIYKDCSGEFVNEAEFNLTYNQPVIKKYKSKYGENWLKMYELSLQNKLHLADVNQERIFMAGRYMPKSKASNNFLKEFK